ncbi:hypothetical protein NMG60_11014876 [Bertholletia excelsa]
MVAEDHEMLNGWPLGLRNLYTRLRVTENRLQQPAAEPPSSSYLSFSSSDLDSESAASFYEDQSVSLGQLIGIRSREREVLPETRPCLDLHVEPGEETSGGICVPRLVSMLVKMSRSKSSSRR